MPDDLFPDLRWALRWPRVMLLLGRCALVVALMSGGIGGLALLHSTERVATGRFQTDENPLPFALRVGTFSTPCLVCLVLIVECVLFLLLSSGRSPTACQTVPPVLVAALGGLVGMLVFRTEPGPKQTMLVAGSALLFFLAVSVQVGLWQRQLAVQPASKGYPFVWYAVVVLLGATFFGGTWGWRFGDDPHLADLLKYRATQWAETLPNQKLALPDEEHLVP